MNRTLLKTLKVIFCALSLLAPGAMMASPGYLTIGYSPGWNSNSAYNYNANFATDVPWSSLSHIYFAFALVNGTNVSVSDPNASAAAMISQAHAHGVRCYLSVGGASGNTWPSGTANCQALANNIANLMNYGGQKFDGVDIDWEFPTVKADFSALMTQLRTALNSHTPGLATSGKYAGESAMGLSMYLSAGDAVCGYDFTTLNNQLDWYTVSGYDMNVNVGGDQWNGPLNDTTLFSNCFGTQMQLSITSVSNWYNTNGNDGTVPYGKMVLGMPLYGRNVGGTLTTPDAVAFNGTGSGYNGTTKEEVWGGYSMDTAQSFCDKMNWAIGGKGMKGIAMWDLGQGLPTSANSMMASIWNVIGGASACLTIGGGCGVTCTPTSTPTPGAPCGVLVDNFESGSAQDALGGYCSDSAGGTGCTTTLWPNPFVPTSGAGLGGSVYGGRMTGAIGTQSTCYGPSLLMPLGATPPGPKYNAVAAGVNAVQFTMKVTSGAASGPTTMIFGANAANGTTSGFQDMIVVPSMGTEIVYTIFFGQLAYAYGPVTVLDTTQLYQLYWEPHWTGNYDFTIDNVYFTCAPTPTPTATPTWTFTFSPTPTLTATPTFTFTLSPTRTFTPTFTNSFTNTPIPPTNTPTFTSTFTPTSTSTFTATPTRTATATFTSTFTNTNTPVPPTNTSTSTNTLTRTFTVTPSSTFTNTPLANTNTPTNSYTFTSTPTVTATFTSTFTPTRTYTPTLTNSFTSTFTSTNSPTFTFTRTATTTFTATATGTSTFTSTNSYTPTLTFTGTQPPTNTPTVTFTFTNSFTRTFTPTSTSTSTATPTPTFTRTSSFTPSFTNTPVFTNTSSFTPTRTFTSTSTNTLTFTPVFTFSYTPTNTNTGTLPPTNTPTSTLTFTNTFTLTNTSTSTFTPVFTSTSTRTFTQTQTFTPTLSPTATFTASYTSSSTRTFTATATRTVTPTNSATATPTATSVTVPINPGSAAPPNSTQLSGAANVPVLQFQLANPGNNPATITSLILTASGTGNDLTGIQSVNLYVDTNGNGMSDAGDNLLGTATYSADNGTLTFTFASVLPAGAAENLLVTYNFSGTASSGTYQASIAGNNSLSGQNATGSLVFSGAPMSSAIVTVASATPTFTPTATPTLTSTSTSSPTGTPTPSPTFTPVGKAVICPAYPNPSDGLPISSCVTVPGPSSITWEVFTTNFRKITGDTFQVTDSGTFQWDLRDKTGNLVANGLYYLRIQVNGPQPVTKVLKVLVIR